MDAQKRFHVGQLVDWIPETNSKHPTRFVRATVLKYTQFRVGIKIKNGLLSITKYVDEKSLRPVNQSKV